MNLEINDTANEMVVFNVDNMVQGITETVMNSIERIKEIDKTKPSVDFHLGRDNNDKLVLLSSVSFPNDAISLSPMEYAERLIALEIIKVVVKKKMKI